jgi:hypothetical protein
MCLNIISYYPALDAPWCLTEAEVVDPVTTNKPAKEMIEY